MKFFPITLLCFLISATSAPHELLLEPFKLTKQSAVEFHLQAQNTKKFNASMGKRFGLSDIHGIGNINNLILYQLALEANTNINLFRAEDESFKLRTMDFFIGLPFIISYKAFFYILEYNHCSDHLGDGFPIKIYNKRIIYSRDYLSNYLIYNPDDDITTNISYYIGIGQILRSYPEKLGSKFIEIGIKAFFIDNSLFIFANLEYNQDTYYLNESFRIGYKPHQNIGFYHEIYSGKEKRGQFYNKVITTQSIGMFIE